MSFALDPVIGLCLLVMAFAVINAWWVTRPFVRERRAEKRAQHHAAE